MLPFGASLVNGTLAFALAAEGAGGSLSSFAVARLQAISFFLVILVVCVVAVRGFWNGLAHDFPRLPRMAWRHAAAAVAAWGMLVLVVLTMIATTREMMQPGSWKKQGWLYRMPPESRDASTSRAETRP